MNLQKQRRVTFLFFLLILVLGGIIWWRSRASERVEVISTPYFQNFAPEEATQIIIDTPSAAPVTITFDTTSATWKIQEQGDFPTDTLDINTLLTDMKEMQVRSVASENKDNAATFGLDAASATRIQFFHDAKEKENILVGKTGPGGRTTYVTSDNEGVIYLMDRSIPPLLKTDWRSTIIASFATAGVKKISWKRGDEVMAVEKQEETWRGVAPDAFDVKEEILNPFLTQASSLQASDIPDQSTALGEEKLVLTFSEDNKDIVLSFHAFAGTDSVLVKNPDGILYLLPTGTFESLNLTQETLVK